MKNANVRKRIKYFVDSQGITHKDFFCKTQLSRGLLDTDKLDKEVGADKVTNILVAFPELNIDWLMLGIGEMLKPNIQEKQQFQTVAKSVTPIDKNEKYRKSNSFDKKTKNTESINKKNVDTNVDRNTQIQNIQKKSTNTELQPGYGKGIKLIPIEAMAGYGEGEIQVMDYEAGDYIVPEFEELNVDYMIRVKGSSMYPKYNSGDLIACKKLFLSDVFFQWNKVYVLSTEQGALVKRIHKGSDKEHILLVSDNPKYEPFEIHLSKVYAIALVVGVIRLE